MRANRRIAWLRSTAKNQPAGLSTEARRSNHATKHVCRTSDQQSTGTRRRKRMARISGRSSEMRKPRASSSSRELSVPRS